MTASTATAPAPAELPEAAARSNTTTTTTDDDEAPGSTSGTSGTSLRPADKPARRRPAPRPNLGRGSHRDERSTWPWTRGLFAVAIVGPALALGGVAPEVLVAFLAVVLALWIRLGRRSRGVLELPWQAWIGLAAVALTALQAAPLPDPLRQWLAPGIVDRVAASLAGTGITAWPSLSPTPADTGLEAARLTGLTLLFIAAAQLPWRFIAALVSAAGASVAAVGLLQAGLGVRSIFGVYRPLDIDPTTTPALLTTFVNPNHQADLFLLAIFATAALLVQQRLAEARETMRPEARMLLWSCLLLVGAALVLSLSRGALLALAITAVPAILVAWLSGHNRGDPGRRGGGRLWARVWPRLAIAATLGGLAAALARTGAWAEMLTLGNPGQGFADKLEIAADALVLHDLSPLVGVGRGAFIDLFPAVDSHPGVVLHTHLESAPATLWVEWGWAGALLGLLLAIAWLDSLRRARGRSDGPARAVALFGIAAVALHSLGDFSLEFLGVAAPAVALAGSLAGRGLRAPTRLPMTIGAIFAGSALLVAGLCAPQTWSTRAATARSIAEQPWTDEGAALLRLRPLDATLHRALARAALLSAEEPGAPSRLDQARHHATVATALRPGESSSWLLRAAAERRRGEDAAADASLRRALAVLDGPPSPELTTYLLGQVVRAQELGPLLPDDPQRWAAIVEAIVAVDPAQGIELATTRSAPLNPASAPILEAQAAAALLADNPALAIHYARLLAKAAPAHASAYLLLTSALERSARPRPREIRERLRTALESDLIDDPAELALLEEALLVRLLNAADAGDEAALEEARALQEELRERPGDRSALQRRHALERRLNALLALSAKTR